MFGKIELVEYTLKAIRNVAEAKANSQCVGFLYEPKKPISLKNQRNCKCQIKKENL